MNEVVAMISIGLSVWAYGAYIRDIRRGKTRPHVFSWLSLSLITGVVFLAQVSDGAGPGAWLTLSAVIVPMAIAGLGWNNGVRTLSSGDKVNLVVVALALGLWMLSSSPLLSVILLALADLNATWPTIRKSWHEPYQETLIAYNLSIVRFGLSIVALNNYSFITVFPPAAIIAINALVSSTLIYRRHLQAEEPPVV